MPASPGTTRLAGFPKSPNQTNQMKKLIFFLSAFALAALSASADTNPFVTNATITPNPIAGSNPYTVFSFDVGNTGSQAISHLDVDGNPDPIVIVISLSNGTYDATHYASPDAAVGGPWKSYFSWSYDPATTTYTATQIAPLPAGDGGGITIAYKATTATSGSNGFNVNLTSNGNAPNGPGTNDITDDNTSASTSVSGPLPVTLVSFSAKAENKLAQLQWVSSEEKNTDRFELQHSVNTKNWRAIGEVKAAGDSKTLKTYQFTHAEPLSGVNYYRLKMIDLDGSFAYSKVASLEFGEITPRSYAYPNPTSGLIKLGQTDFSKIEKVELISSQGQVVHKAAQFPQDGLKLQVSKGFYFLKVSNTDGSQATHKIIVTD